MTPDTNAGCGALRAGTARRDTTPAWPVLQGGYGQRQTPSTGVLDRIFTKALYLEYGDDLDRTAGRILLITADLICIPEPLGERVRDGIAVRTGLDPAQICICASHTHSAPVPWDPGGTAPGIAAWIPALIEAMIDAGSAAMRDIQAVRMRTGIGRFDLLCNRWTRGRPNTVDPRVPVVVLDRAVDGQPAAVLFGAGCHPVTLGWDSLGISGDFPGRAQARIERTLGVPCALFFNTTEGDVIPATSQNRDALDPRGYCGGTTADTDIMAEALAGTVCSVVRDAAPATHPFTAAAMTRIEVRAAGGELDDVSAQARLQAARRVLAGALGDDFETRIAPGALWAAASAAVIAADLGEPAMRQLMIACCHYLGLIGRRAGHVPRTIELPVQTLIIGPFVFAALPGEVLVEVGTAWRRQTDSDAAFVIALANAHYRYLPLAARFAVPDAAEHYETVTAGLERNAVDRALVAAHGLLAKLRGRLRA
ncbi:MAG: hypothetical protein KF911_02760 [Pseudomonadales bacterium]|nr:hypothetical protein [Pseudomonadales bacterium]